MFEKIQFLFSILVGLLGFIVVFLLIFSYKSNKIVNGYLAVVIIIASTRSIAGVSELLQYSFFKTNQSAFNSIALVGIPCLYLYFKVIIENIKGFETKNLFHFIYPIALYLYFEVPYQKETFHHPNIITIIKLSVVFFIFFYFIKMLIIYYRGLYSNKSKSISKENYSATKKWLDFLFIIITFIVLRLLIVLAFEIFTFRNFSGYTSSIIQSILLIILFLKILLSPEILYGYPKLIKQVALYNEGKEINPLIWKSKTDTITNIQESKLKSQLVNKVDLYILSIDNFVREENPFRNPSYSINDLSAKLNIPASHLSFIFKYHCKMSFVEYKNYSKIKDSLNLINENFLESKTLDYLAYKVGFKSYNNFYISFKKHTNYAPKEWINKIINDYQ